MPSKNMQFDRTRLSGNVFLEKLRDIAKTFPKWEPKGYAKRRSVVNADRVLNSLWSDMHYGADLLRVEMPEAFTAIEEARRTAKVVQNMVEYKTDKRNSTRLHLLYNGDGLEGMLGHDDRASAELVEQFARFQWLFKQVIFRAAEAFPIVDVYWLPGNHGRNKQRHPDRATSGKYDNFEMMVGIALRERTEGGNVRWHMGRKPYGVIETFGKHRLFMTHGDTLLSKNPDVSTFAGELAKINASRYYQGTFDTFALGHWHRPASRLLDSGHVFVNGSLVPPNGHAEANGFLSQCGQWLWETTEKYPVGDQRLVRVGPEDDADAALDSIVAPYIGQYWSAA